ncbi:biotin synthase [Sulfurospirillum sp. 1307]|jgi:biotin synthase
MSKVFLCAICNVSSGSCNEDCKFCTQSAKYKADIQRYKYKEIKTIVEEAKMARANGAVGFCLVTSGLGLDDKKVEFISNAAFEVKKELPEFNVIACNGTASIEQLKELKKAGVTSYNHNLETSKEFYPNICTTHSWESRYETCLNVNEVGLNLVSGGIFGLGESQEDRVSFINSLKELNPKTTPLNFYHPNEALPLKTNPLHVEEALKLVKWARGELKCERLMVAGGREFIFKERQAEIFKAGANAIVIGDYLTTSGNAPKKDVRLIESLGLEIAKTCHG